MKFLHDFSFNGLYTTGFDFIVCENEVMNEGALRPTLITLI